MVSIRRGDITEQSFGFTIKSDKWENLDNESKMATRTILEVDRLYDVSPVTYAAYPDTSVAVRSLEAAKKSDPPGDPAFTIAELPETLRDYAEKMKDATGEELNTFIIELKGILNTLETKADPTKGDPGDPNASGDPTKADPDKSTGVNAVDDVLERTKKFAKTD
jgi:hypothetical protein